MILKRNTNIPADANAMSFLVTDLDKFSEEGMQLSNYVLILMCFVYHVSCAEQDILLLSRKRYIFFFILGTSSNTTQAHKNDNLIPSNPLQNAKLTVCTWEWLHLLERMRRSGHGPLRCNRGRLSRTTSPPCCAPAQRAKARQYYSTHKYIAESKW